MSVYHILGLLLLWCGLISAYVLSSEELSSEEDWHDACVDESGVNTDHLECLPYGPCLEDPKLKCFVKCALIAYGIPVDADGVPDFKVLLKPEDENTTVNEANFRLCAEVRGYDACDTAYQTYMCWVAKGLVDESSEEESNERNTIEEETIEETSSAEERRQREQWLGWHRTCVAETEVDEDLVPCVLEGLCAEDPKLKCYVKCMMTQTKVPVTEDGGLVDIEALLEDMSEETRDYQEPILRECSAVGKGADDCDTAYLTVSCWLHKWRANKESIPEMYQEILDRR